MTETLIDSHIAPEKTEMPKTWRGELSALLALGIPMGLAQLAQFFVFFMDVVMIGRLTPEDVAAASVGSVFFFSLWMLGAGPAMAISPLVSQVLGADKNERRDARRSVRMTIWALIMLTPIVIAICLIAEPISLAFGQDPAVARKAAGYTLLLGLCWPFALIVNALRNFLAAIGKTRIPFILVMATTAINIALNWIFIFGNLAAPRLELIGAGIASLIASVISLAMFVIYIRLDPLAREFNVFERFWTPDWDRLKTVVALAWPISITTMFEGMLFNAAVFIAGAIGVIEQAAYQIGLNFAALAFMFPFGLAMAGGVRIGLAEGSKDKAAIKRVGIITVIVCIVTIGITAIFVALSPELIAAIYLDVNDPINTEVISWVVKFLPIAAAFMLFDAVQVAANQLLRGLKDVKAAMIITGISYWAIGFPVAYGLALHTPYGAVGIWYGLSAGLFSAALLLGGRFWYLAWRR